MRFTSWLPIVAILEWIDADDDETAPPGYTEVEHTRTGLIVGGSITFAVGYLLAAAKTTDHEYSAGNVEHPWGTQQAKTTKALWIPIVGPFVELDSSDSGFDKPVLALIASAQIAGAFMLYFGIATKHRDFVRSDLVRDVRLAPIAAQGAQGLALAGSF